MAFGLKVSSKNRYIGIMRGQLREIEKILRLEAKALNTLAANLTKPFADALDIMTRTEGKVILSGIGKSGHVARKISSTLVSTGCASYFIHPAEASHGDLGLVDERDTVIALSNSGESSELQDIVSYTRRFKIPLIAVTGAATSMLAQNADVLLLLPQVEEACPLGLAPTTSTTMMLALGDALASVLLKQRGFSSSDFRDIHPGGSLGARLLRVTDLMHSGDEIPLIGEDEPMAQALLVMTGKRFGCVGAVGDNGALVGIVTDGDLRRSMSKSLLDKRVREVMTRSPNTIAAEDLAVMALRTMNEKAITVLFVCENGNRHPRRPLGIIHIHDCLRAGVG